MLRNKYGTETTKIDVQLRGWAKSIYKVDVLPLRPVSGAPRRRAIQNFATDATLPLSKYFRKNQFGHRAPHRYSAHAQHLGRRRDALLTHFCGYARHSNLELFLFFSKP